MENAGEHLVGQYLREIKNCDFVVYNLQTDFAQGEIDVIGISTAKKEVFVCEVATHLQTGLQYTKNKKVDNIQRFLDKFKKNITYAKKNFEGYNATFMLWSPIIKSPIKKNAKINQLKDILEIQNKIQSKYNIKIELIYNEKYLECINELRVIAKNTKPEMKSPIMRFLQIEEKTKAACNKGCN